MIMKNNNKIVSSESEDLILVDENDQVTGTQSKGVCHDGDGILHRAFSLLIFNEKGELLLQRRSRQKRLWPGFWSNSCCSHPRAGETIEDAIHRRLDQEMGIRSTDLRFVYKFQYHAKFEDKGSENELCYVYVGTTQDHVRANVTEVDDWRYIAPVDLEEELTNSPEHFTPWFKMEWNALKGKI
jgi:isopentenyl-diphosphate delta-isomerase